MLWRLSTEAIYRAIAHTAHKMILIKSQLQEIRFPVDKPMSMVARDKVFNRQTHKNRDKAFNRQTYKNVLS